MKLEYIKLGNYRQYKDVTIHFSMLDDKNFTIIQGENGAGKTNILNAITWCLYDEEKHLDKKNKGYPIYNNITIRETEIDKKFFVSVELLLRDEENKKIIIERKQKFRKLKNLTAQKIGFSKLQMLSQVNGDIKSEKYPEGKLDGMIPESIEGYFFFDGEKLKSYLTDIAGSSENIRRAVFRISQLDLVERAINHLKKMVDEYTSNIGDISPEIADLGGYLIKLRKDIGELKKDLDKDKEKEKEAGNKIKEYTEKLSSSSISNVSKLEEDSKNIESELKGLEEEIKRLKENRFEYLINKAPYIYGIAAIQNLRELINKGQEAGDIPSEYKRSYLKKILLTNTCICGTKLSENEQAKKNIENLINKSSDVSDISEELIVEQYFLENIIKSLKDFSDNQVNLSRKIKELEKKREDKSKDLKGIDDILLSHDSKNIRRWKKKILDYGIIQKDVGEKIGGLKFYINQKEGELDSKQNEFDKQSKVVEKSKKLRKKLKFCERSLKILEDIREEVMEDIRIKIEEKTKKQFLEMIWKTQTYTDVKILSDYRVSVVNKYNTEALGTLSSGEKLVLALSFIASLNEVSGFDVPIIIDTPIGRISSSVKENIARSLHSSFEKKQVVLLMTDVEYSPDFRDILEPKIGKEYEINFIETGNGEKVEIKNYAN